MSAAAAASPPRDHHLATARTFARAWAVICWAYLQDRLNGDVKEWPELDVWSRALPIVRAHAHRAAYAARALSGTPVLAVRSGVRWCAIVGLGDRRVRTHDGVALLGILREHRITCRDCLRVLEESPIG